MPTMNVSLSAELAHFVEEEVASGDYVSASEVVRDALRVMRRDREVEDVKLHLLRQAIDVAMQQAERGEFSDRSIDDIAQEVLRNERR
jgi:antitoxin ParD1/3/4